MFDVLRKHPVELAIALMALIIIVRIALSSSRYKYEPKALLTQNEYQFYTVLRDALPEVLILPQVAMNAFIQPGRGLSAKRYSATRGTFAQKHVDFLICEPESLKIMAIIELDDRSHTEDKDIARDKITGAAGYKTLRFHSRNKPGKATIRESFAAIVDAAPGTRIVAY